MLLAFVQCAHDEVHVADDAFGLLRAFADTFPADHAGLCDDARTARREFDGVERAFSQTAVAVQAVGIIFIDDRKRKMFHDSTPNAISTKWGTSSLVT